MVKMTNFRFYIFYRNKNDPLLKKKKKNSKTQPMNSLTSVSSNSLKIGIFVKRFQFFPKRIIYCFPYEGM